MYICKEIFVVNFYVNTIFYVRKTMFNPELND